MKRRTLKGLRFLCSCARIYRFGASDVRYLFNMLINEFYVEKSCKNEALENIVKLILIKTYRDFIKGGKERANMRKKALSAVLRYIKSRAILTAISMM